MLCKLCKCSSARLVPWPSSTCGWLPGARGDVQCRTGERIWYEGGRANPPLQAPHYNTGAKARNSEAQDIPLLHWHKLGSEKQYSAEDCESQLSLNLSTGKHGEPQEKEGRKWHYLKLPILKGMATNSSLWPKYHWLAVHCGAAQVQDWAISSSPVS